MLRSGCLSLVELPEATWVETETFRGEGQLISAVSPTRLFFNISFSIYL